VSIRRDLIEWKDIVHRARANRFARHSEHHAARFVLRDGARAGLFHVAHNHVRDFADRVEHILIDGFKRSHQELLGKTAGEFAGRSQATGSCPSSRHADQRYDPRARPRGGGRLGPHLGCRERQTQHRGKHFERGGSHDLGQRLLRNEFFGIGWGRHWLLARAAV
jgi:hypothetical protein